MWKKCSEENQKEVGERNFGEKKRGNILVLPLPNSVSDRNHDHRDDDVDQNNDGDNETICWL